MKTRFNYFIAAAALSLSISSCKSNEDDIIDPPVNESELITTVILTLTDSLNASDVRTFTFKDLDGEGGNAPTQFDMISLTNATTYYCQITLLDESVSPAVDISAEVAEEKEDHQFFFQPSETGFKVTYADLDANNKPVGLSTRFRAEGTSMGTLTITLKHQPGTKDGNISTGETDIALTFDYDIAF